MASEARRNYYASLSRQATVEEAGSLAKPRAVLLLWFLRNVVGVGELEAYDFITDGDNDHGIDGLFLEYASDLENSDTLVIYQSKFGVTVDAEVGDKEIDRLAGAAVHFENAATLSNLLSAKLEPGLRALIGRLGLVERLQDESSLKVRLVIVASGLLTADAARKCSSLNDVHGQGYCDVWNIDRLGPMAEAVKAPDRIQATIRLPFSDQDELLRAGSSPNRVAVLPVDATTIAAWPGIDSRALFALNVRHELGTNKVSRGLDRALGEENDHRDFLAYHNGITVVCDEFRDASSDHLEVINPSVVNGAQSVLALKRAERKGVLTQDLRMLVKLVEVKGRPSLEKEVSRRSNTQTGVNPRNLMANSGPQLRLLREFEEHYPTIIYETRQDTVKSQKLIIRNDEAAQLLCAVFNAEPWLAVKKNTLFESDHHPHVFSEHIFAHHIVFANALRQAVDDAKDSFPERYRTTWLLTRLVACYMVGEILREAGQLPTSVGEFKSLPLDTAQQKVDLAQYVFLASVALGERSDELGDSDQFKTEFKNEAQLRGLGGRARSIYKMNARLKQGPGKV